MPLKQCLGHVCEPSLTKSILKSCQKYWGNVPALTCRFLRKPRRGAWLPPQNRQLSGCSAKLPSVLRRLLALWAACLKADQGVCLELARCAGRKASCQSRLLAGAPGAACGRPGHMDAAFSELPAGHCWQPRARERHRFQTWVIDELCVICKCECINLLNDSLIYVSL